MPSVSFVPFQAFIAEAMNGEHDLATDTLKLALTNDVPVGNEELFSEFTEVANGNGYTTGGATLANVTSTQTAGVYKLEADAVTWNPSGGAIGPFNYFILYNSGSGKLIGYWNVGSSVSISAPQRIELTFQSRDVFIIQ